MLSSHLVSDDSRGQPPPLPYLPPVDPAAARGGADITPDAFAGFLTDGDTDVATWALRRALQRRSRAEVYDTFVREAMQLVGERWLAGRWTISDEHLASRTLMKVLGAVAPAARPQDRLGIPAVLASVAGEDHSIGLVALAQVLTEAGFEVADLGSDVPAEDLSRYAARSGARLVAIAAMTDDRLAIVRDTVAALRALPAPPTIMVGGRIADVADLSGIGADWTGSSLVAVAAYAEPLARRLAATTEPR